MPVSFLTVAQHEGYGAYRGDPTLDELDRYFHLDDADRAYIKTKRGDQSQLGFALQLTSVRYLGTFLDDPTAVPASVLHTIAKQTGITDTSSLAAYAQNPLRWSHTVEIRSQYGYCEFTERIVGFRLTRWLCALCWTGTDRPGVLFERATTWLLTHKVLLPGITLLERLVVQVRSRMEKRLWRSLGRGVRSEQREQLQALLLVPEGSRGSWLDRMRSGPTRSSGPSIRAAIERLRSVRELGIALPATSRIPPGRIAALAQFANRARAQAIARMPADRRLATLVAFVLCQEATAQDDVLEVLQILLQALFGDAVKADKKARLRALKDLDQATATLIDACSVLLDATLPEQEVRAKVFIKVPRAVLEGALKEAKALIRPPDDVFYLALTERYTAVRRYLPAVLRQIRFEAGPAGQPVTAAYDWLRENGHRLKPPDDMPRAIIGKAWKRHVVRDDDTIDLKAYTFCLLDGLKSALHRRDVFVHPSWRYADPRANLIGGVEWEAMRPMVCRTLGLTADPTPTLNGIALELDRTYRDVAQRLPVNPAVRFETVGDREELILTPFDKLDEPASLVALRAAVAARLPRVDLPEVVLEIIARTGLAESFTHLTERAARVSDLAISLAAVLMAEACNTGPEPFVRSDNPALKRDRMAWVKQNYLRDETLTTSNAKLVAAQNGLVLAHAWGGGEVASADGMRFVVPIRTVHAGPNPKYFGRLKGVTWYNLMSNQFTGLNAITVPGTLRDSLILLAVVLEQQTELQPTQIMTDSGAYSDVVFGLFRLLGFRFSPRLADIGGTRFWRIDPDADYGKLDVISTNRIRLQRIAPHWDDILRLVGSLLLGRIPAAGIMRTLQVGDNPTRLAQAIAEFGRIDKTLHALAYINSESTRRATLVQLNRGEGRHSVARVVFHGKRGELRQRYREGQEDQLGALGLVVNMITLWNTIYMEVPLEQLRKEGFDVRIEDAARLSPHIHDHINMQGRYSLTIPEAVAKGALRPLRDPAMDD